MDTTEAAGPPAPQELDAWFLALLGCPGCEQRRPLNLNEARDALHCPCGRYAFPIRDGIPVLLLEEAALLDAQATPGDIG